MRFSVEQHLEVPRPVAEQALVDPRFYASMGDSGPIDTPEVLSRSEEDGAVRMAVRYRFNGHLSRPARAVLDPEKLTWVIDSLMHFDTHVADFVMVPDHYADRFDCCGRYRFEERGPGSAQIVEGELRVHVPVVGAAVERAMLMGLRQNLVEQARLMSRWATGDRKG